MRSWIACVVLAPTLLGLTPAAAQGGKSDSRLARIRAPLESVLADLKRRGIDTRPVRSKISEGLAKGVPPARILHVVRRYAGHLREGRAVASRIFKQRSPRGLNRAYADARLGGVRRGRMERLLKVMLPRHRRARAVWTIDALTDLVARGYLTQAAYGMVLELARKGKFAEILRLRGTLARIRKRFGLTASQSGVALHQALVQSGADLSRALIRLDQQLPVADPSISTRGAPAATPGMDGRGP